MNLEEAKEILEIETGSRHEPSDPDLYDAQKLGIEAIKLYMALKAAGNTPKGFKLTGETEE